MKLGFGLLFFLFRSCFLASFFLFCIVSIAVHFLFCQFARRGFFTSHSTFIVFWERDITSEHHKTPVHILITVYTLIYFLLLISCSYHYHYPLRLIFFKQQDRRG